MPTDHGWPDYDKPVPERLREAAAALLDRYVQLVESGDCGNWDPHEEPEVQRLAALLNDGGDHG